jgi:hypothetical protein
MFASIRRFPTQLRLWLIVTAAVLLLTSILEVGHGHGVFAASDDNCILCQHSVALDKTFANPVSIVVPLLPMAFAIRRINLFISHLNVRSTHIRAPPV